MSLQRLQQVKQVRHEDWPPEKCRPELLLHRQIPKPLHGLNPRTILGDEWWQAERRKAIASTDNHCAACGVHRMNAEKHQWLECHEQYDYVGKQLIYKGCVPLCHYCHAFIHRGRLQKLVMDGQIPWLEYDSILQRGYRLTRGIHFKLEPWVDKPNIILGCGSGWSLRIGDQVYKARR